MVNMVKPILIKHTSICNQYKFYLYILKNKLLAFPIRLNKIKQIINYLMLVFWGVLGIAIVEGDLVVNNGTVNISNLSLIVK
jgi:hypothetical protein